MLSIPNLETQIHIWFLWLDQPTLLDLPPRWECWLLPVEHAQCQAFRFHHDRRRYIWSRWMLRHVLSLYAPVDPGDWVFATNNYGRPFVLQPYPNLYFNLSHTRTAIVLIVGQDCELGIDVEDLRPDPPFEIVKHVFTPAEQAFLDNLSLEERFKGFWCLWTLKESYVKARGMGLSIPLQKFGFITLNDSIQLVVDSTFQDNPTRWHFTSISMEQTWHISTAQARSEPAPPKPLIWHNARCLLGKATL